LSAAEQLFDCNRDDFFNRPAHFLLAHGAELTFKAALVFHGQTEKQIENLGHDIWRAFDRWRELDPKSSEDLQKHVAAQWRGYLRSKRAEIAEPLLNFGLSDPEILHDLGIPTHSEIGDGTPKFIHDLQWLSQRHRSRGRMFRYLSFGHDQIPLVQFGPYTKPSVPRSILWGCQYALGHLTKKYLR
jgi:hypothetical protein